MEEDIISHIQSTFMSRGGTEGGVKSCTTDERGSNQSRSSNSRTIDDFGLIYTYLLLKTPFLQHVGYEKTQMPIRVN